MIRLHRLLIIYFLNENVIHNPKKIRIIIIYMQILYIDVNLAAVLPSLKAKYLRSHFHPLLTYS